MLIKSISIFEKSRYIYTYLNLYYVINTMKTWLDKESLKKAWKLLFYFIVVICFVWTIYSLVPYLWSMDLQEKYNNIWKYQIKEWNTYDNRLENFGDRFADNKFQDAEYIQLDKEITINKDTVDYDYQKMFAYKPDYRKDLKLTTSGDINLILDSLWTKDHRIFDEPEYDPIIWQWGESCYIFRFWQYLITSVTMEQINNPDNCKIIWIPIEFTNRRILYFHFPITESIKWWTVKFQELDKGEQILY